MMRTAVAALIFAGLSLPAAAQSVSSGTDPSLLTTQAINEKLTALKELILTRMDANDKAVTLLHDDAVRVPTAIDQAITHLKDTDNEKFRSVQLQLDGIETQIHERDGSVAQAARDNKVNLDSALLAQKALTDQQNIGNALANSKTEDNFKKQITDLTTLMNSNSKGQDDKIGVLTNQIAVIQGRSQGNTDSLAWMIAAGSALIAVISVALALFRRPVSVLRARGTHSVE